MSWEKYVRENQWVISLQDNFTQGGEDFQWEIGERLSQGTLQRGRRLEWDQENNGQRDELGDRESSVHITGNNRGCGWERQLRFSSFTILSNFRFFLKTGKKKHILIYHLHHVVLYFSGTYIHIVEK